MPIPELVGSEKQKYLVKLTGDIEIDVISNLRELLRRELKNDPHFSLGALEIYDIDTELVPRFPAICLDLTNSQQEQTTIGPIATYIRRVHVNIWYYHADIVDKAVESAVRLAASRIVSVIFRNSDLHGYSKLGIQMPSPGRFVDKVFGTKIVRGFVFPAIIPIIYRDRG